MFTNSNFPLSSPSLPSEWRTQLQPVVVSVVVAEEVAVDVVVEAVDAVPAEMRRKSGCP